jgi:hypothetical protein
MFNKTIWPLVILFLVIGACILIFRQALDERGIDWQVVSGGNLIIYLITIISIHLLSKGLKAEGTHAFLNNAYSGVLFKLFGCAIAAFIYIFLTKEINKPALFACMGLYLIYTFVEMRIILKQSKDLRNGRK